MADIGGKPAALFVVSCIFCVLEVTLPPAAARAGEPKPLFRFTEITAASGLEDSLKNALNHAIAWGDFDGDGKIDVFLGNFADRPAQPKDGKNVLYRQVEPGKFEYFPCPAVERRGRCSGAAFVDLDNDGKLDLVVTSNTLLGKDPEGPGGEFTRVFKNPGDGKFIDVSEKCGIATDLSRTRDVGVLDFDGDGLLDLFLPEDSFNRLGKRKPHSRLFKNLGGFKLEDVTARAGLPDDIACFGMAIADLNGDGRPDIFVTGSNRLFLTQKDGTYKEAEGLRKVFEHVMSDKGEDITSGCSFGDLDNDGDLDLVVGPHFPKARVHVYLNEGLKEGIPQFKEITKELGIPVIPQKAPHVEINDFDNDGIPDLYFSAWFGEGSKRWPFICRGLGVKDGLPRFDVPSLEKVNSDFALVRKNLLPKEGVGMVYYVNGPAIDFDGDGDLDFLAGIWPEEGSRVFRNETKGGNWLQVRVEGRTVKAGKEAKGDGKDRPTINTMGIGAQVRIYEAGKAGKKDALLGFQEITVNIGYSSSRPAVAHFGLGERTACDIEVTYPGKNLPVVLSNVKVNRATVIAREVRLLLDEFNLATWPASARKKGPFLEEIPADCLRSLDLYPVDYESLAELKEAVAKSPRQHAVIDAVLAALDAMRTNNPLVLAEDMLFAPITPTLRKVLIEKQKTLGEAEFALRDSLTRLQEARGGDGFAKAPKRWRAHADLTQAILLGRLVSLHEYSFALALARAVDLPRATENVPGWRLKPVEKLTIREGAIRTLNRDRLRLLEQIAKDHPDSPWFFLARREHQQPLGLRWEVMEMKEE